ncbi:hypothetical protein MROS_0256 [Melioribacter roseus P3M-2]|uniref:FecR protein domain-containing protein n=1 Tax=Melioribacter roseus (strain DSM 23840 / JCM 17771 / VKM B-2668 / P3M-2) TaxID=1191523 RepID=I6Z2Z5_MELRP|nr:FecR family protein [Melioribacter roseus]AFN73500.1 hypothetical protein MROS_0256 [Melioribacter roseus P3M-2]
MRLKVIFLLIAPLIFGFNAGQGDNKRKPVDESKEIIALIKKAFNNVTYRLSEEESEWREAKIGLPLSDGNELRTGSKSLAVVIFKDGSGLLRVRENSILHIYGASEDRKLNKDAFIQRGMIGFDVNKQSEGEEFRFTTPTVVASIRGTNGFLEFDEDSTFTMSLESGMADLSFRGPQGGTGQLNQGNTVVITPEGNFQFRSQNQEDMNKINLSKQAAVKKIYIETDEGTIEIEYYAPEE